MSKAEEFALKHFPVEMGLEPSWNDKPIEADTNRFNRRFAEMVYEWAEQELALTAEDVARIFNKVRQMQVMYSATDGCFQEVADWFNEMRK